ncbi:uncharacterized protein LOC141610948 [Silene latifolia]|uniref:uncharacterized protein LOC141610948 n=1 Tax=Silene latifolia TaxID=37657 RepID=UPI003D788406
MENSNKTVHHSFSGNNENESESLRNSQQKNKNFMSPTISASSKFNSTPNKKVLGELKSPKSDLGKLGNSNSGSRKSLPKIPLISPKNVVHSPKTNDEFVHGDDSVLPYDPLTNYLSPRPRFLRYRPNRRREILVKTGEKTDTDSDSDSDSCIDSLSKEESEEIVIYDQKVVLDEEDEDLDEFEEENWGLKWGLFKFLIVLCSVFFCTMCICSMNSSSLMVKQEFKGVGIEYKQIVNMGFKIVSLRSLDSGSMVLGGKNSSDSGLLELDYSGLEFDENLSGSVEDDETEILTKVKSLDDYYQIRPRLEDVFGVTSVALEVDQKNVSRPRLEDEFGVNNVVLELVEGPRSEDFSGVVLGSVVDNSADVPDFKAIDEEIRVDFDNVGVEEHEIADARVEYYQAEIEAQMAASELSEAPDVEVPNVGDDEHEIADARMAASELSEAPDVQVPNVGEEKSGIADARVEYYQTEIQAQVVASEESEAPDVEDLVGMPSSEVKSNMTVEGEIRAHFDKGMEDVEAKSKQDYRLTFSELIWPVISPLVAFGLLSSLVWRFYCKCRKASSKTRSSNVKFGSNIGKAGRIRQGLPPKSAEKTDRYRQLNASSVRKIDHSEVSPPLSANPVEILERDVHTIIPKVKQLGEFEVGVEFTHSIKTYPSIDETMCSTLDIKGATRRTSVSSSGLSTSESYSRGSYVPQDTTSMKKDGREEVSSKATPTPRRSTRLRSKGVTSP